MNAGSSVELNCQVRSFRHASINFAIEVSVPVAPVTVRLSERRPAAATHAVVEMCLPYLRHLLYIVSFVL